MKIHNEKTGGRCGRGDRETHAVKLSCDQMQRLIARHYADDWRERAELKAAAEAHLASCRECHAKLLDLEIGFEAAMRIEIEGRLLDPREWEF